MILEKCLDLDTQTAFRQTCLRLRIDTKVANQSPLLCLPVNILGNIAEHLDPISMTKFRATHSWLDSINKELGYHVEFPLLEDKMEDCEEEYYGDHVCDYIVHAIKRQEHVFWSLFDVDRDDHLLPYLSNITKLDFTWTHEAREQAGTSGRAKLKELGYAIMDKLLPRLKIVTFEIILPYSAWNQPMVKIEKIWMPPNVLYFIQLCLDYDITTYTRITRE